MNPNQKKDFEESNILTTSTIIVPNKITKQLSELKDFRLKDFNKIPQYTNYSNKKTKAKGLIKELGKDLFKPIEVLSLDKRRNELKDNMIKYIGQGGGKVGRESFSAKNY
jgi:hypothetical protein